MQSRLVAQVCGMGAAWRRPTMIGGTVEPVISREEFAQFFMEQARLTPEQLERYVVIEPCECADPECLGWATIPRTAWKREQAALRKKPNAIDGAFLRALAREARKTS